MFYSTAKNACEERNEKVCPSLSTSINSIDLVQLLLLLLLLATSGMFLDDPSIHLFIQVTTASRRVVGGEAVTNKTEGQSGQGKRKERNP